MKLQIFTKFFNNFSHTSKTVFSQYMFLTIQNIEFINLICNIKFTYACGIITNNISRVKL